MAGILSLGESLNTVQELQTSFALASLTPALFNTRKSRCESKSCNSQRREEAILFVK